jgi:hypothetical protein
MNEILIAFSKDSPSQVSALAKKVRLALLSPAGLGYFPSPEPSMAAIETAITVLDKAIAAEDSSSAAALRKSLIADLVKQLLRLVNDLELTADGDPVMLAATGFDLRKKPGARRTGPIATPENLRLRHSPISGDILAKVKAVEGADNYHAQSALSPDGPWIDIDPFSNSQQILFKGLPRGKDVYIRVRANGPNGPGGWSDIATIMVI